jgi:hypothetical protein
VYPASTTNRVGWYSFSVGTVQNILSLTFHGVSSAYLTMVLWCVRLPELPVFFITNSLCFRAVTFFFGKVITSVSNLLCYKPM